MSAECRAGGEPWRNWAGNQEVYARCIARPRTLTELVELVRGASDSGGRMRAVATGLSFSDILQADDTLAVLTSLTDDAPDGTLLPLENELWKAPVTTEPRVRIICGARIRELNAQLDAAGLAFPNLGGFDGQTFIGALSTSTHGSGAAIGPLCDLVRSLDLVSAGGQRYRIEPRAGITDVARFRARYGPTMTLVQDDTWFHAALVSLGCMGVIHSVVCKVRAAFDIVEHRRIDTWRNVRRAISAGIASTFRHFEVIVNPYRQRNGEHTCLVTERRIARPDQERVHLPRATELAESITFLASTQRGMLDLMTKQPRLIPVMLEAGLNALATGQDRVDKSYEVYNVGKINTAQVLSGEYFMPLAGDRFVRGVDRLIEIVGDNARRGLFQNAPLALRFIKGSPALLSMMHGQGVFGAVEVAHFSGSEGAAEALLSYEQALYAFDARPHWGQMHELTGTRGWLAHAYPQCRAWQSVRRALDPRGVFDNHFTDRLSLSVGCEDAA